MPRTLNPRVVDNVSAFLFWLLVRDVGVPDATDLAFNDPETSLCDPSRVQMALSLSGVASHLSPTDLPQMLDECVAYIQETIRTEQLLIGEIYAEDFEAGQSPTVPAFVSSSAFAGIAVHPKSLSETPNIPVSGKLILRTPLPSIVITDEPLPPGTGVFRVRDTSSIGTDVPVYMTAFLTQRVAPDLHIHIGLPQVPVPSTDVGELWGAVLPNAARFRSKLAAETEVGMVEVVVHW